MEHKSLTIQAIPAIDTIEGRCVRLTQGDYGTSRVYADNPLEMAQQFEDLGFRRLHLVDLDGAKNHHVVNLETLERITRHTRLTVDFGGGVKTDDDMKRVLDAGASLVTVGSIAVKDPDLCLGWLEEYGPDRLILGADVRHGKVSINGWKEDSDRELNDFLETYMKAGMRHVLCTEISKDGTLNGPAVDLYGEVMRRFPECRLIASGGVGRMEDLWQLQDAGVPAVVFGKAIYEGRIDLKELAALMNKQEP